MMVGSKPLAALERHNTKGMHRDPWRRYCRTWQRCTAGRVSISSTTTPIMDVDVDVDRHSSTGSCQVGCQQHPISNSAWWHFNAFHIHTADVPDASLRRSCPQLLARSMSSHIRKQTGDRRTWFGPLPLRLGLPFLP